VWETESGNPAHDADARRGGTANPAKPENRGCSNALKSRGETSAGPGNAP